MKRTFEIHYNTGSDEKVLIEFKSLGADSEIRSCEMTTLEGGLHHYSDNGTETDHYRYVIVEPNGRIEERHWRFAPASQSDVVCHDTWRSPEDNVDALRAEAFRKAVFTHVDGNELAPVPKSGNMIIALTEPRISADEAFCVVSKQFVNWNVDNAMVMTSHEESNWVLDLGLNPIMKEFEFKFGIWDVKNNKFKRFEEGSNHIVHPQQGVANVFTFNSFNYGKSWRAAGVAVPVFSLRTHSDRGCGEFLDLIPLADWCHEAHLRVIQLLPVNDTTALRQWRDSYPYNAISVMALHPSYISVDRVYAYYGKKIRGFERETGLFLNDSTFLDYNASRDWKDRNLRAILYGEFDDIVSEDGFKAYLEENAYWVKDYAAFATLREKYGTPVFREWASHSNHDSKEVDEMFLPHSEFYKGVMYRVFLQYHLEKQLREAIDHAHSLGIAIKGDLPIGINPNSVEAWAEPELFNFGLQAGAPPDFFSRDGQNWGFPTYRWDVMKRDGFAWWKKRLHRMEQFFDAFRIDHILGFFRIWSIPRPFKSGIMGIFSPAIPLKEEEIRAWGFSQDLNECSIPVVTTDFLRNQLGEYADAALELFEDAEWGRHRIKREYFSPEKTDEWVSLNVKDTARERIRNGFANILHEVLFVTVTPEEWHPRMMVTETNRFQLLNEADKSAIKALSDDFFFNRHDNFWKETAEEHLGVLLDNCKMLVCGEDLGMIPSTVPVVMQRKQILTLELQRMPKMFWEKFGDTSKYPYLSVCATSSHDISSIRGWWEEDRKDAEAYYKDVLKKTDEMPNYATEEIVTAIVDQHLAAPSMLCINPIQDYAGMINDMPHLLPFEERINVPSNGDQKWRYRIPFYIDDMLKNYERLTTKVREHVWKSGRE